MDGGADEAVISARDGNCKAFSSHGCLFKQTSTPIGSARHALRHRADHGLTFTGTPPAVIGAG
jgi:hypothetical protein